MHQLPSWNAVLKILQKDPNRVVSIRELVGELRLRSSHARELKSLLREMARRKLLVPLKKSRFRLPAASPETHDKATHSTASPAVTPSGPGTVRGRLIAHPSGYGFVVTDQPLKDAEGDVYVPARAMGSALHGDRVEVQVGMPRAGRVQGQILGVVDRLQKTVVGEFHRGNPENFVTPFEQRIPPIAIPHGREMPPEGITGAGKHRQFGGEAEGRKGTGRATSRRKFLEELEGMVVEVELTTFPRSGVQPRGRVTEILGRREDFGIDVEITIRKFHLPHRFPSKVLEEAQEVFPTLQPEDRRGREDFRGLPIVTIDGETAKDFDDAVYVERLGRKRYRLDVHIADVAHYVRPGTATDREARLRGTSVYFPDRAVPMLPLEFSNGICSLNPCVDRLALSVSMEIDSQGEVLSYDLAPGVIHSAARMTYTEVQAILDGESETRSRFPALLGRFELMEELAQVLIQKRERRGSIDFDLPEPEIEFDLQGRMVGITRSDRKMAHRIIEEFMLAANETVAEFLTRHGVGMLYRVHEKPEAKKVLDFEKLAATFGYSLGVALPAARRVDLGRNSPRDRKPGGYEVLEEDLQISSRHYQRLTQKIAGKPEERILSYLMLRSLKQARYSEENVGHFALAAVDYTHFTSPIRRYPDLVVHRLLKDVFRQMGSPIHVSAERGRNGLERSSDRKSSRKLRPGPIGKSAKGRELSQDELRKLAAETSEVERRAQEAERDLMDWKKAAFMAERVGEEFDALITNLSKFGISVELMDYFVEGSVPMATLPGDRFAYRERDRAVVEERSHKSFRFGDRIRIRLDRIDRVTNRLEFSLAGKE